MSPSWKAESNEQAAPVQPPPKLLAPQHELNELPSCTIGRIDPLASSSGLVESDSSQTESLERRAGQPRAAGHWLQLRDRLDGPFTRGLGRASTFFPAGA